jgi:hypothetical protein
MSDFFAGVCFGVAGMALLVLLDGIARKLVARERCKRMAHKIRPQRHKADFDAYWMELGGTRK